MNYFDDHDAMWDEHLNKQKQAQPAPVLAPVQLEPHNPPSTHQASLYEAALVADLARLKEANDAGRIRIKRDELLPRYLQNIDSNVVLFWCMIWSFDVGDYAEGVALAQQCIERNVEPEKPFTYSPVNLAARALALAVQESPDVTTYQHMTDVESKAQEPLVAAIQAELYKAHAIYAESVNATPDVIHSWYKQANETHSGINVKRKLNEYAKLLEKEE